MTLSRKEIKQLFINCTLNNLRFEQFKKLVNNKAIYYIKIENSKLSLIDLLNEESKFYNNHINNLIENRKYEDLLDCIQYLLSYLYIYNEKTKRLENI